MFLRYLLGYNWEVSFHHPSISLSLLVQIQFWNVWGLLCLQNLASPFPKVGHCSSTLPLETLAVTKLLITTQGCYTKSKRNRCQISQQTAPFVTTFLIKIAGTHSPGEHCQTMACAKHRLWTQVELVSCLSDEIWGRSVPFWVSVASCLKDEACSDLTGQQELKEKLLLLSFLPWLWPN